MSETDVLQCTHRAGLLRYIMAATFARMAVLYWPLFCFAWKIAGIRSMQAFWPPVSRFLTCWGLS